MNINGKVVANPQLSGDMCKFTVLYNGVNYEVISRGHQAVKDNIFIEQGQDVQMDGKMQDNVFYTTHNRINIKK